MNILSHSNFDNFNCYGLKELCRYNRNIFMNYNSLSKENLIDYIKSKLNDDYEINIPPFIYDNKKCYKQYK